jgi:ERCC4-type nuclease
MILVDYHEDPNTVEIGKKYLPNLQVEHLLYGDIQYIKDGVNACVFEIKIGTDLPNSIRDKRLSTQPKHMKENFQFPFVIFVGTLEQFENSYKQRWFTEKHYHSEMASIMIGHDVKWIQCPDLKSMWKLVKTMIIYYDECLAGKHIEITDNSFKRIKRLSDEMNMLMAGVHGIGEKKAELILSKHPLRTLWDVPKEKLMEIPGIGDKFAGKIKEAFPTEVV